MPVHLEVGLQPVAGYTLVRPLGRGGFGEVWEALAPGGVRVALKFIRLDTTQADLEQRALEVIRNIRHPHLLDVQFAVRVEDCLVIAMPLCDESLIDRLRACRAQGRPGVPRDELLGYMEGVARAVDFLNEPRHPADDGGRVAVQHRDIKPDNIFLVGGMARLADFGLAKVREATNARHTGSMTPHYAAPEVIEGRISGRSDQYSLAVSYVELRTGRLPFTGAVSQVLYAHVHHEPDLSGLPEEERRVAARALAKRPEQRWPTCGAFVLGLEAAALAADGRLTSTVEAHLDPGARAGQTTERGSDGGTKFPDTRTDDGRPSGVEAAIRDPYRRPRRIALAGLAASLVALGAWIVFPGPGPAVRGTADTKLAGETVHAETPEQGRGSTRLTATEPAPERHGSIPATDTEPSSKTPASQAPAPPREAVTDQAPDPGLAQQAHAILKTYCHRCHGVKFEKPPLDVLNRDILVALPPAGKKRAKAYVVAGKPEDSLLWQRVGIDEDMPPEDPSPSDDEKATLKRWIAAGAAFPDASEPRPFVGEKDILAAIRDHLERTPEGDRIYQRYFTLANLHNDRKVLDDDLTLARAALTKLVNSLSWKPKVVVPVAVDRHRTAFAVDLRDLGWDQGEVWRRLVRNEPAAKGARFEGARDELRRGYPYGLLHRNDRDAELQRLAAEVARLAGYDLPAIRADWFIATASRPPLYEEILGLPANARELERRLDVSVESNFLRDRLARAGFSRSGVSSHNRIVERHDAAYGAYWKSYDFKLDEGTAALARFPLGPVFADNPFGRQAFEHAGGEIIFNLPNGMQGYLLVNARDERIAAGPIDVVGDALRTSGTAAIVNGLSCMACHKDGMIAGFADEIRAGHGVAGDARVKVEQLYPGKAAMDRLLDEDADRFLAALEKATGGFLKGGGDTGKPIRDFPEPIGAVARWYVKELVIEDVAAELGLDGPERLRAAIQSNPELRRLGLGPLLQPGATIKRAAWESLEFLNSPFQNTALQLELGTPHHEL